MFTVAQSVKEKTVNNKMVKSIIEHLTREIYFVCCFIDSFTTVFQKEFKVASMKV